MTDITKQQLKRKDIEEWSEEETKAAEGMTHTITANYAVVRRLAALGTANQTYEDILTALLDEHDEGEEVLADV